MVLHIENNIKILAAFLWRFEGSSKIEHRGRQGGR